MCLQEVYMFLMNELLLVFPYIMFCGSRFQRPPGLIPSSMLGLESITGTLEDFGVEDYLQGNYLIY